jgi:NAD(P)-dependent dehydrogenase (short-subunit alcohol dehydrogenase family)
MSSKGATVHILDINPIDDKDRKPGDELLQYHNCNIVDWVNLRNVFTSVGHVDIAVANAGISESCDYFADTFDAEGNLAEPDCALLDVNYRSVLNFTKLSIHAFRKQGPGGSLIFTTSSTAYVPVQSLPIYSATKLAVRIFCVLCSSDEADYGWPLAYWSHQRTPVYNPPLWGDYQRGCTINNSN